MSANILRGPPQKNIIINQTLGEYIFNSSLKYAKQICQIDATSDTYESFESVHQRSIRLALKLKDRNITPNDVVASCTSNHLDSMIPIVAAMYIAAQPVSLDPNLSDSHVESAMKTLQPKIVFVDEDAVSLIERNIGVLKTEIVVIGKSTKYTEFSELVKEHKNEQNFLPTHVDPKNIGMIILSSGTTGPPKGITLSHYAFLNGIQSLKETDINFNVSLHFSNLYWISGTTALVMSYLTGGKRIFIRKFEPELALKVIEKYKVTYAFISPYLCNLIVDCPNKFKYDLSTMNTLLIAGSPMSATQFMNICEIFKNQHVSVAYGMSEVGFATLFRPDIEHELSRQKIGSSGRLLPNVEVKVVNVETNQILGPNQKGEVRLKSIGLTSGYFNMDSSNQFDEDGFIKGGDIGYFDEDGCIFIVDRIKEMFKYKSWHIIPSLIEAVLYQHPAVIDCVVFGLPHEVDGEVPTALVVLKKDNQVLPDDIVKFVNSKVHDRENLRGGVKIVESIPKTPNGKVNRMKVREFAYKLMKD